MPILTYHSLDDSRAVTSVAPRDFTEHMGSLARRGFTGISLSDLLDGWAGKAPLPLRPVVLTFDDGWSVCVILASAGYPETSRHGDLITGLDHAGDFRIYHAGTRKNAESAFERLRRSL